MTQSNLLESAKQGDSHAIAALMNLTLEPRGITATTTLEAGCLQVVLSSTRILNQKTLVGFVQKGLQSLSVKAIQTVKICGQKVGESLPVWTVEFAIDDSGQFVLREPMQAVDSPKPASKIPINGDRLSHLHTSIHRYWNQVQTAVERAVPQVHSRLQPYLHQAFHYAGTSHLGNRVPLNPGRTAHGAFNGTFNGLVSGPRQVSQRARTSRNLLLPRVRSPRSLVKLTLVALPIAFLFGGLVAVIDSYARSTKQAGGATVSTPTTNGQMAIQSEPDLATLSEQSAARKYLDKMNRAQKQFYAQNGRLASSLEELERSANMLSLKSQEHNYTYRLTVLNETQAQLTATPKNDRLKSFTGIVFLTAAADGTETAIAAICESKQPMQTPPVVTKTEVGSIQCPANANKVS